MDRLFTENLAAVVLYLRKLLFASLTVGLQSIKRERKKITHSRNTKSCLLCQK